MIINQRLLNILDSFVVILGLVSLNASALAEYDQFPALDTTAGRGWQIAFGYISVVILIAILLAQKGLFRDLISAWRNNPWLLLFLGLSAASILWSVYPVATLYETILLICSTCIASYFAIRYRHRGMIHVLTWFAAACTALSLLIVFFTPLGIMHGPGHADSWRGLFWHRNHTGSLMAFFAMIFLARVLMDKSMTMPAKAVLVVFYLLAAWHVFGSRSATGKIIFVLLNFSTVIAWAWINWRTKIKVRHYWTLAAAFTIVMIALAVNLPFFFGLFGRSVTMTGRTMMWPDLFNNFYLTRPILGHGFGAIWMQESFRATMQARWDWNYQPYFADNGYLDLLLNLGAAGLASFIVVFVQTTVRTFRKVLASGSWTYLFALLTLLYVFLANLSYSFLFEVDYFVWWLLVIVVFLVSMPAANQA